MYAIRSYYESDVLDEERAELRVEGGREPDRNNFV